MARKIRWGLVLCLVGMGVLGLAGPLEAAQYWYYDLGTLPGGTYSYAYAINDQGQIAGYSGNAADWPTAFRWTPGDPPQMEALGTLGGYSSQAWGLNNAGQVVGESQKPDYYTSAFLSIPGSSMQDLGMLPGGKMSYAYDINDAGQVVGYTHFDYYYGDDRPCWWTVEPRQVRELPLPHSWDTAGPARLNKHGQVVGWYNAMENKSETRACLWTIGGGNPQNLGTLGGNSSVANDINDLGEVVGTSKTSEGIRHVFLWTPEGGMQDLTPAAPDSRAFAINNAGQIVGSLGAALAPFVWTRTKGIQFLNELVVNLPPNVALHSAYDLNNRGQIVGVGTDGGSPPQARAFLLTPIPEPVPPDKTAALIPLLLLD